MAWYEDSSTLNEGLGTNAVRGEYEYGVTTRGGFGSWGGLADSARGGSAYDFVIPGGPFNQTPTPGSAQTNASAAHYYSGYWAGVQGALYGFGPPEAPPIHSYGFATDVLQALEQPPTQDLRNRISDVARSLGTASHPFGLSLTPEPAPWSFGENADEWPPGLPDWGAPAPRFHQMAGRLSDFSTAYRRSPQLINPELRPDELDPSNFVGPYSVGRLIFDQIRPMTNADAARIGHTDPSDITPGNVTSQTTPPNAGYLTLSDPNMWGITIDFGEPRTFFGDPIRNPDVGFQEY